MLQFNTITSYKLLIRTVSLHLKLILKMDTFGSMWVLLSKPYFATILQSNSCSLSCSQNWGSPIKGKIKLLAGVCACVLHITCIA